MKRGERRKNEEVRRGKRTGEERVEGRKEDEGRAGG